jgi:signal transduction histidine kinase
MWTLTMHGLAARESFAKGAAEERQRIAADLHDDIGGKLLHLANVPGAEGVYARNTLEDLRTLTRGLSAQTRQLHEVLSDIRYQLAQRAERHGLQLEWLAHITDGNTRQLGARQATVLTSICSELLRNAMQQDSTRRITFEINVANNTLLLLADNDGVDTDPTQWREGLGTLSIRRRVHDLQGQCDWSARPGGGVVFNASWSMSIWHWILCLATMKSIRQSKFISSALWAISL